jgi:hypothetical protein
MNRPLAFAVLLALAGSRTAFAAPDLTTTAERSGFARTGRYEEVIALCAAFQQRYPQAVRCMNFGTTPQGRPMKALVVSRSGALTPEAARSQGLPVLLVQGGIHAGEIDGKDAGFLAIRQALEGKAAKGALEKQVMLFVPVFNVDGHERFAAWNRPNQRGPEEMGWRVTAQNYNLNRDYVKADSAEMRAMLRLVNEWDPLAAIDLHVTDGAKFQHDVSIQVQPVHAGDEGLRGAGKAFRDAVIAAQARQGSKPLAFYPSFVDVDDPASGFVDGVSTPRFSTGYFQLRNRFAMLVETHSWKDYATRVRITCNVLVSVLEQMRDHGVEWRAFADAADARAALLGGSQVPLDYAATEKVRQIEFLGYAYTRTPSDVSGALMTRYDETRPQVWRVPLRDEIVPGQQAVAPKAGYLVPAAYAARVGDKLRIHGIDFRKLDHALARTAVQAFRATRMQFAGQSVEGHQRLTLAGAWAEETQDIGRGALFVPIAQPKARLLMALFEPLAPDALVAWGEFNNHFEQKEYLEAYVAEEVAREMLARDPALAEAFSKKLRDEPEFARDPQARLDYFSRRHSAWDEAYGLYPVLRLESPPQ